MGSVRRSDLAIPADSTTRSPRSADQPPGAGARKAANKPPGRPERFSGPIEPLRAGGSWPGESGRPGRYSDCRMRAGLGAVGAAPLERRLARRLVAAPPPVARQVARPDARTRPGDQAIAHNAARPARPPSVG